MTKKTIVAGLGYLHMRDLSVGPVLTQQFALMDWPHHVTVDADFSYGPIAVVQRFQAEPDLCERIVLFAATNRDRKPGTIDAYKWNREIPEILEIHERVVEAVTGVVGLDNLLIVGEHFGIWPSEVFVVDVEPAIWHWGDEFSPVIENVIGPMKDIIRHAAIYGEIKEVIP